MPELPEVETIAGNLRLGAGGAPPIVGRKIVAAHLFWERTLAAPSPAKFQSAVLGQTIQEVGRRGKFLLLKLTRDVLMFHLRMSGDMLIRPASTPPAVHDRLVLDLNGGVRLAFNDARKFGRVWLVHDPAQTLNHLGPEPLDPGFTAEDLYRRLHAHRRQLKPLLLDQTFLAGMGNIYTDEALHLAGLHPLRLSHTLSEEQAHRLQRSIRLVLEEGIRLQGASIDWVYRGGDFQNHFRVYRRADLPCPVCRSPIRRMVVGQRGTYFCPVCQPAPMVE